eukprot:7721658-Alexandrium_andersonii.AAC.1
MEGIGSGSMHLRGAVRLARSMCKSQPAVPPAVRKLAGLGTRDYHNVERDAHRRLQGPIQQYELPLTVCNESGELDTYMLATIAPHEMFAALHRAGTQFNISICGSVDGHPDDMCAWLQAYWEHMGTHTAHLMNEDPSLMPYRHCTW